MHPCPLLKKLHILSDLRVSPTINLILLILSPLSQSKPGDIKTEIRAFFETNKI